jgi:hypothetical protein
MQVSRTTRKVRPRASQGPRTSLGFDERNRLVFVHALAPILAVCSGQSRGELEPNDLAFDNGCRVHDTSVRKERKPHKLETTMVLNKTLRRQSYRIRWFHARGC